MKKNKIADARVNALQQYVNAQHVAATKRFLSDPDTWPYWPVLPMKNDRENGLLGFLLAADVTKVFVGNIFQIDGAINDETYDSFKYNSIGELIAAGWLVN